MDENPKFKCDCGWRGCKSDLIKCDLIRQSDGKRIDVIHVCPDCDDSMDLVMVCDEPDCWEEPHPMLCFQHGGSPRCEEVNRDHNFVCPKCDELNQRPGAGEG